jgi:hypothetical protein
MLHFHTEKKITDKTKEFKATGSILESKGSSRRSARKVEQNWCQM